MPLHPEAKAFLEKRAASRVDISELAVVEARELFKNAMLSQSVAENGCQVKSTTIHVDDKIISIRIYTPIHKAKAIILFFHGGGFVLGTLDAYDHDCRRLCVITECTVVAVDYRLAPEHKFPAALEDCIQVVRWMQRNVSQFKLRYERLIIVGDSAGGNLVALTTLILQDDTFFDIALQVLIYPVLDFTCSTVSHRIYGENYTLTQSTLQWCYAHYLNMMQNRSDPLLSPIFYENFNCLPQSFILAAEFDILRDEAFFYAEKLRKAGAPVKFKEYNGMIHGFISLANVISTGFQALQDIAEEIDNVLNSRKTVSCE